MADPRDIFEINTIFSDLTKAQTRDMFFEHHSEDTLHRKISHLPSMPPPQCVLDRESFKKLAAPHWFNDQIINAYVDLLKQREAKFLN